MINGQNRVLGGQPNADIADKGGRGGGALTNADNH